MPNGQIKGYFARHSTVIVQTHRQTQRTDCITRTTNVVSKMTAVSC